MCMLSKAAGVFVFLWLLYIFINDYQETINAVILYDMDARSKLTFCDLSITVLTLWVAPPKMFYNWYRI